MAAQHKTLSERLLRYSAVASLTASAGLLASPAHTTADINALPCVMDGLTSTLCLIDFDDPTEATPEFGVQFYRTSAPSEGGETSLNLIPMPASSDYGYSVIGSTSFFVYPFVLPFDYAISSSGVWQPLLSPATMYFRLFTVIPPSGIGSGYFGNWDPTQGTYPGDGTNGAYVGVKFKLDGSGPYYGWIEIYYDGEIAVVKRIGYNTNAGNPIPAAVHLSETNATTGLRGVIAAGLAGLSSALLWLRRRFAQD